MPRVRRRRCGRRCRRLVLAAGFGSDVGRLGGTWRQRPSLNDGSLSNFGGLLKKQLLRLESRFSPGTNLGPVTHGSGCRLSVRGSTSRFAWLSQRRCADRAGLLSGKPEGGVDDSVPFRRLDLMVIQLRQFVVPWRSVQSDQIRRDCQIRRWQGNVRRAWLRESGGRFSRAGLLNPQPT